MIEIGENLAAAIFCVCGFGFVSILIWRMTR